MTDGRSLARSLDLTVLAALLTLAQAACTSGTPAGSAADVAAASRAVEAVIADSLFPAIGHFDYAAIERAVTPTFELVEDTLRLSTEQFMSMMKSYEGQGTISYRFDGFRTQVQGPVAWTSYRNHGTLTPASGPAMPFEWLETAVLVQDAAGQWRVDRLHSTPIRAGH